VQSQAQWVSGVRRLTWGGGDFEGVWWGLPGDWLYNRVQFGKVLCGVVLS
jgi:hypothetical protein